jgi:hypothetical protein
MPVCSDRRQHDELTAVPVTSASARHSLRALLTVHLLATVGVFGADLVLLTVGISALFGADVRSVYPPSHLIAEVVVQPLAIVSLATGVALGLLSGWGLVRFWWTAIKLAITAALTLVVLGVLVPTPRSSSGPGSHATRIHCARTITSRRAARTGVLPAHHQCRAGDLQTPLATAQIGC